MMDRTDEDRAERQGLHQLEALDSCMCAHPTQASCPLHEGSLDRPMDSAQVATASAVMPSGGAGTIGTISSIQPPCTCRYNDWCSAREHTS